MNILTLNQDQHRVIFGRYRTKHGLKRGVELLKSNGFQNDDIAVLSSGDSFPMEKNSFATEGAKVGAVVGGLLMGTTAIFLSYGAFSTLDTGPIVNSGALKAGFIGGILGITIGGFAGTLVGAGIPEYREKKYFDPHGTGGVLVSVNVVDGRTSTKAMEILKQSGARDIGAAGEVFENEVGQVDAATIPKRETEGVSEFPGT